MLERLRRLVRPPPLETTYDEAPAAFEDYHGERLEDAREKAETIRTDIATAVVDLESGLRSLEEFDDERDRVEDVVSHVATKRRAHLEQLTLSDDPEALSDAVETFLQDRSDLSRKEAAILRQVELPAEYREAVEEFKATVERLDQFLANEYELLDAVERLEELVETRRKQIDRVSNLEAEIEDLEPGTIEDELQSKRDELATLREGGLRQEYDRLEEQLNDADTEREEILGEIGNACADCRRGLRKLIYAIENEDADIDTDIAVLKDIRDGETEAILDREPEHVETVVNTVTETISSEHLDEPERSRLREGLELFENLTPKVQRIEELDTTLATLENRLETHEYQERKDELQGAIDRLEDDLESIHSEEERLEQRLSNAKEALSETETHIEEVLEAHVPGEVTLENR